jgi:hypothetical protein
LRNDLHKHGNPLHGGRACFTALQTNLGGSLKNIPTPRLWQPGGR